jgi:phosphatidylserine/phosphatidylglycerophosphate/cardiolipin synthase-like enzyme
MWLWRRGWQTGVAAWWSTGDFPPRAGNRIEPLIDGHAAMLRMCEAFLAARRSILLTAWDIRADLPLVRGDDLRLDAEAGTAEGALRDRLRRAGLDEEALAFWAKGKLTVADALGFAATRGARVSVLLWDAYQMGMHLTNNPNEERENLERVGVEVLLDDSCRSITHFSQSLHQKCAVVDSQVAFVGGIDLTCHEGGDYDRWDTHSHLCASDERTSSQTAPAHPWHDAHARLEGPIVGDIERNLIQRWNSVAARHHLAAWPERAEQPSTPAHGGSVAQIVRTVPPNTYPFARRGVTTIYQAYMKALSSARQYVYLESQYLWMDVFAGLDNTLWAGRDRHMKRLLDALAGALNRGVSVALVLPDHPNCGREFSDAAITYTREHANNAARDRFSVFTLGNSEETPGEQDKIRYRPVYVHAKLAVVDDQWWTVGSANLNSRGMRGDAEINVAALDHAGALALRLRLWQEHAHPQVEEIPKLNDPMEGIRLLRSRARANFERVRRGEALVGHLLPYITHREARAWEIEHDREHGWLDHLEGGAGPAPANYAARYL